MQNTEIHIHTNNKLKPTHTHFSQIPNILGKIELTPYERSLYLAIKDAAGENGACTKSVPTLAKESGMCESLVQRVMKKLAEPNKVLKKPLIKIKKRSGNNGGHLSHYITLVDIWTDNEQ